MVTRPELHVVIVDPNDFAGLQLHNALGNAGAIAHVVKTLDAATRLIENSQIDAAVVTFANDKKTKAFLAALAERYIPVVYISEPPDAESNIRSAQRDLVAAVAGTLARHNGKG